VVLFPADHASCLWLYCALHHETGHLLDQDLGLENALKGQVLALDPKKFADPASFAERRRGDWWKWTSEMVADAFGLMLGGSGYALSLASTLLAMAPAAQFAEIDPAARHPNPLVRLPLLCSMLEALAVPEWMQASKDVRAAWEGLAKPGWLDPYVADVPPIAQLFLDGKLDVLKGHALRELMTEGVPANVIKDLAFYLRTGLKRPPPRSGIPPRAVPAAAQLALDAANDIDGIHARGIDYLINVIPRPKYLGPGEEAQLSFLKRIAKEIRFAKEGGR
jgi:hypothetical protein